MDWDFEMSSVEASSGLVDDADKEDMATVLVLVRSGLVQVGSLELESRNRRRRRRRRSSDAPRLYISTCWPRESISSLHAWEDSTASAGSVQLHILNADGRVGTLLQYLPNVDL